MITKFKYSTVSAAISDLRKNGFTNDFQLEGSQIKYNNIKIDPAGLEIAVSYRYEGNSDPGDEASVYGLESTTGLKGILVTGDEIHADEASAQVLKKLHLAKNKSLQKINTETSPW
jgi:hypothetical protein